MEFKFKGNSLIFDKELSNLDKLVLEFVSILDNLNIDYVIISGYIAILFGRSRETEDVDLFITEMSFEKFREFWRESNKKGFECLNAFSPEEAFNEFLEKKLAIRFAVKGTFIPNFELKYPTSKYNRYSLMHKLNVLINNENLNTSELELQIAFKLKLGSDKDFEDARHLYNVFKNNLNLSLLKNHISELMVGKEAEMILWKKKV